MWRFADYDAPAGRIAFHIALFRKDAPNWKVEVHTTPQRPLFQTDLITALAEAGFAEVRAYGRMTLPEEPFDVNRSGGSGGGGKEGLTADRIACGRAMAYGMAINRPKIDGHGEYPLCYLLLAIAMRIRPSGQTTCPRSPGPPR